jgi:phenylpyruvate tautomerase PptA (4-oxalocrotonate tautomerase family)
MAIFLIHQLHSIPQTNQLRKKDEIMPYFSIKTNVTLGASEASDFAGEASSFACRLLGKPEKYMMVSVSHSAALMFGGAADPAAFVEFKSIGLLEANCKGYSKAICEFLESNLKISPERIYIDFKDIDARMFGWNKTTF